MGLLVIHNPQQQNMRGEPGREKRCVMMFCIRIYNDCVRRRVLFVASASSRNVCIYSDHVLMKRKEGEWFLIVLFLHLKSISVVKDNTNGTHLE